jgi:hypothetical protein
MHAPHGAEARPSLLDTKTVRLASYGVAAVLMVLWAAALILYILQPDRTLVAADYRLYMEATARWLGGGPFYEPYQLAGPYPVLYGDILYPPYALPLFVVFQVLPAVLWWVIPIGGTLAMVLYYRPRPIAIAMIALCFWFPATSVKLIGGNPVMWAVLAVALGTKWAAASPWALIKPSLFPFAMVRMNHRAWWVSSAVLVALCVLMLPLMLDWLTAVRNGVASGGLLYSVQEVPMMALPVFAWLGRGRAVGRTDRSPATLSVSSPDQAP